MAQENLAQDASEPAPVTHSMAEDAFGFATGVVLANFGAHLLIHLGLVTGQTAGLALVIAYATGWEFGLVFFAVNLPFYYLALTRMGLRFTLRTIGAVAAFSLIAPFASDLAPLGAFQPIVGATLAGLIIGVGLLALIRHGASLGGVGVLAIYLQDQIGFRAGWTQLLFDLGVFTAALFVIDADKVLLSLLGAAVLNVLLALNHRRDHYVAR